MIILFHLLYYLFKWRKTNNNTPKVIYQSNNFIVINKPFDLKINSNTQSEYTIQTFLQETIPEHASGKLYHNYFFAHRLDFATSGVLCVPLNKNSCKITSQVFEIRETKKYYLAILRGIVSKEFLYINQAIGESEHDQNIQKMCTADNLSCTKPRNAVTVMLAIETGFYENYYSTKVLIRTITGRRHQIRVHCAYIGHTIIGDYTYSNKKDVKPFRMFLHSFRLILPNKLENLDVQTDDPFLTQKLDKWVPIKVMNTVSTDAFKKIDDLVENYV